MVSARLPAGPPCDQGHMDVRGLVGSEIDESFVLRRRLPALRHG